MPAAIHANRNAQITTFCVQQAGTRFAGQHQSERVSSSIWYNPIS
jgi:hypothetical protein